MNEPSAEAEAIVDNFQEAGDCKNLSEWSRQKTESGFAIDSLLKRDRDKWVAALESLVAGHEAEVQAERENSARMQHQMDVVLKLATAVSKQDAKALADLEKQLLWANSRLKALHKDPVTDLNTVIGGPPPVTWPEELKLHNQMAKRFHDERAKSAALLEALESIKESAQRWIDKDDGGGLYAIITHVEDALDAHKGKGTNED